MTPPLLQARCNMCGVPVSRAPDVKAMCKVCRDGVQRMRQATPQWIDEVVRRAIGSVQS